MHYFFCRKKSIKSYECFYVTSTKMCKKIRHKISYNDKITQTKAIKIPAKNNLGENVLFFT